MNSVSSELRFIKQIKPLKPLRRHGFFLFFTKWALRVLVLLLLLVVLAGAAGLYIAQTMFTPQHISMLIAYKLQEALHRPVVVENARVLVYKGLKVDRVRVLGRRGDILSAGPIEISYRWMPPFKRRLEVDDAAISNVNINTVIDSSGAWRLADAPEFDYERGDSGGGASAGKLLRMVSSANLNVKDLTLVVRGENGAVKRTYSLPELHLWDFSVDKKTPFRLGFEYEGEGRTEPVRAGVYAEGFFNLAGLNMSSATLTDTDVRVTLLRNPVYLKLNVENFERPRVLLRAVLPAISDKDLYPFTGKSLGLNLPKAKVAGTVTVSSGLFAFDNVVAEGGGMTVRADGEVRFSSVAPAAYRVALRSNNVDLGRVDKYWVKFRQYLLSGKASVALTLRGDGRAVSADSLRLSVKNAKGVLLGFLVSKADFSVQTENGKTALKLANAAVKIGTTTFSGLKGAAVYDGANFNVPDLSGLYNDSRFRLRTEITDIKDKKKRAVHAVLKMNHIDIAESINSIHAIVRGVSTRPAPKPVTGELAWLRNFRAGLSDVMPRFRGTLYAEKLVTPVISGHNLKVEFDLRGISRGMKTVSGKIDASLEKGVVYQLERMAEQNPALNVTFKPFLAMHRMETAGAFQIGSILRDVGFNTMAGSTNMKNGAMWINTLYFDGPVMSAYMDGLVDWCGEKLDLNVYTRLNARRGMGGLSENLTDSSGSPALSFNIKNTMLAPKVTMKTPDDVGKKISAAAAAGIRARFADLEQQSNKEKPKRETAAETGRNNVGTK